MLFCFFVSFFTVGVKISHVATSNQEDTSFSNSPSVLNNNRLDIVDRNGDVLATNIITYSLYAHPYEFIDTEIVINKLMSIFPDLNKEVLIKSLQSERKFVWIKKKLSPEQQEQVKDLGEPGLYLGPRKVRLYPNGSFASHILGGTTFGKESVNHAEIIGSAGVELFFDKYLKNKSKENNVLTLSIDLPIQSIIEKVLSSGIKIMNSKGGSAVLINANNGEIISLASFPDFDPNNRPIPIKGEDSSKSPLFNRAAQGLYELGSTFKVFTIAQALDEGYANTETIINTKGPLMLGKKPINDFHYYGPTLSLTDVIVKSSNVGTARIALNIGSNNQKRFLQKFGFIDLTKLELPEANKAKPIIPSKWSKISTATISYGHGISVTPVHLAAAYSTLVNGGLKINPTLIKLKKKEVNTYNLISPQTSYSLRKILRKVVTNGTAKSANVDGYQIGGKTGTADKVDPINGGYLEDKVRTIFVSAFPIFDPKYVLVVILDEPEDRHKDIPDRTASATAVPVSAEIIRRIAPILGLRPYKDNNYFEEKTLKVVN